LERADRAGKNDYAAQQAAAQYRAEQMEVHRQSVAAENTRIQQEQQAAEPQHQREAHRQERTAAQKRNYDPIAETDQHFRALQEARMPTVQILGGATESQIGQLKLGNIHKDMNGNIISGTAADGVTVGIGQTRSFEEQLKLVQSGKL